MSYDLHITRADFWAEAQESEITADEWLALVEDDESLTHTPENGGPFHCEWKGECRYGAGTWFDWQDGQIYTKNPDSPIIRKMLEIANLLGARVQGDDGEIYEDDSGYPAGYKPPGENPRYAKRSWWQFWRSK